MPPTDEHDPYLNTIHCFLELPMAEEEEEEDKKVFFNMQHSYNTRSRVLTSQDTPQTTSAQGIGKTV